MGRDLSTSGWSKRKDRSRKPHDSLTSRAFARAPGGAAWSVMKVKMILPALTEAMSPYFRPDQVLALPAARPRDAGRVPAPTTTPVDLQDEHVERLRLGRRARPGRDPGLHHVGARAPTASPTTTARRGRLRGASAACTSRRCRRRPRRTPTPSSSGPARTPGRPSSRTSGPAGRSRVYRSVVRTLDGLPPIRRDLIQRQLYLVPNSIVVSRGCPHVCDFCYKEAFFEGGRGFYTQRVDDALAEIERLPGPAPLLPRRPPVRRRALRVGAVRRHARHGPAVAGRGHRQLGPAARPAREGGGLRAAQPVRRLRDAEPATRCAPSTRSRTSTATTTRPSAGCTTSGVMVNGSFVFGMDEDEPAVFDRTVDWAIAQGHRDRDLPHPDAVPGHRALRADGGAGAAAPPRLGPLRHAPRRVPDARHVARRSSRPATGAPTATSTGGARSFAAPRPSTRWPAASRHVAYAAGWKKFEPLWDLVIRARRVARMRPVLESVLSCFGLRGSASAGSRTAGSTGVLRPQAPLAS